MAGKFVYNGAHLTRAPIGLRLSSRRRALRLSQAELARRAGISPSYLNLIEANKRQVGGSLLRRLAEHLQIEIGDLTGEAEHRLIHDLEEAFADPALERFGLGSSNARDLVAENPSIAAAIARLHRAYSAATSEAEAYANRLRSDPLLSQLLHQILSGITAVRSGAEILGDTTDLDPRERDQFLASIGRETRSLSELARTLIGQFERTSASARSISPRRELDDLIFGANNHFPELEVVAGLLRDELGEEALRSEALLAEQLQRRFGIEVRKGSPPEGQEHRPGPHEFFPAAGTLWFRNSTTIATRRFQLVRLFGELAATDVLERAVQTPLLSTEAARALARRALSSYLAGAVIFPYDAFLGDAQRLRYDIDALRDRYAASYEQVAHRLVTLRRPGAAGVPFGFLRADPAGRLTKHFPLPGLLLPNSSHACPLWAIYGAFRTPDATVRQVVQFTDGSRYLFVSRTVTRRPSRFSDQTLPVSIMLACDALHADATIYADGLDTATPATDIPVGPTCRLCTRHACPSRQEPALAPEGPPAVAN